jgi:hypothetical protein
VNTPADRRLWLDLQAADYLTAVEAEDFDRQDAIWALAAHDSELEEALHAVHAGMIEEADAKLVKTVADAVVKFLPSAEVIRPAGGPVTVGMVAEELYRHTPDRLPAAAHTLNERLRQATEELPAELGLSKLVAWAEARFGTADPVYWKAFREAALKLELRAAAETEYQLAARKSTKPGGPK